MRSTAASLNLTIAGAEVICYLFCGVAGLGDAVELLISGDGHYICRGCARELVRLRCVR
jgi:hypothetical protein